MAKKAAQKISRQINRAGKQPAGGNSGIFSNSGFGQKYDNKTPTNATHSYATVAGSHKKLREELHRNVSKSILPGMAEKKPTKG